MDVKDRCRRAAVVTVLTVVIVVEIVMYRVYWFIPPRSRLIDKKWVKG